MGAPTTTLFTVVEERTGLLGRGVGNTAGGWSGVSGGAGMGAVVRMSGLRAAVLACMLGDVAGGGGGVGGVGVTDAAAAGTAPATTAGVWGADGILLGAGVLTTGPAVLSEVCWGVERGVVAAGKAATAAVLVLLMV